MTEIMTLVFDGPHVGPAGGLMARAVTYDSHGCEVGWYSIDSGDPAYGPTAEHPDREQLNWPEGIDQPYAICNGVDESWAVPTFEDAILAACHELATRIDGDWWDANGSECRFASACGPALTEEEVRAVLSSVADAAIYLWNGEVYLDHGAGARMIDPAILGALSEAGVIAPTDPADASIWLAV